MIEDFVPHMWPTEVDCNVYVDNIILFNHYNIKIGFDTSSSNPILHDIAFEKIQMFFEVIMNNSIIITKEDFISKTFSLENNYIQLPGMLNDQTLGAAIFTKLTSLVGEDMIISYVQISSTLGKNVYYTLNNDAPEIQVLLPKKEEWWKNTDIKSEPWWMRSDTATYDEVLKDNNIYVGDFDWKDHFEEDLKEAASFDDKTKRFKIINGGKDGPKQSE